MMFSFKKKKAPIQYTPIFSLKTIDEQIDYVLRNCFTAINQQAILNRNTYTILGVKWHNTFDHPQDEKEEKRVVIIQNIFAYMVEDGLIEYRLRSIPPLYKLTLKGYRIREQGGWLKYCAKITNRGNATKSLDGVVKLSNKVQIFSALLTLLVLTVEIYILYRANEIAERNYQIIQEQNTILKEQNRLLLYESGYYVRFHKNNSKQGSKSNIESAKKH